MKQKRSMDEALTAAKELRKSLNPAQTKIEPKSSSDTDPHLKVISTSTTHTQEPLVGAATTSVAEKSFPNSQSKPQPDNQVLPVKPIWVRHTIGLRDTTSLSLRDAADGQKRKERHGQLKVGEPSNEQEIADLGITLALKQLGYL